VSNSESPAAVESIAVIGLTGRFPGARNVEEFWKNLQAGAETISRFSEQELNAAGVDPVISKVPGFVNAGCILTDIDQFDAVFFGYSARDAESIDPQQRLFLECAWECLESAGYDSEAYSGLIGVFGGSDMSSYLYQVYSHLDPLSSGYGGMVMIGNDKDYLTTQVSYKLNLKGPSIAVQTSCSTSLVAVCVACQSLWSYGCDMALAGGVSIAVPQKKGYFYMPGGILSPDGHCRTFDAEGQGTVVGNGVALVLLKRLSDALADGDTIHAVIKGAAINNDGSAKVGYTAPSIEGQAQVIAMAHAMAGVDPASISYVEAHGTATMLGDPIEVEALRQVFRARTSKKGFCAIGSVKSNVGHLASAAGVTGLIKTVLSLEKGLIPPSLNFKTPNPQIEFDSSPFFVNDKLRDWERNGGPRRAGVSSFGVGGTNAHLVLEEAPVLDASGPSRPYQLITLSAKSANALENATTNLASHLKAHAELNLADVSFSQSSRRPFAHRRVMVARSLDTADAAAALESGDPQRVMTGALEQTERAVVFMFSGQGSQYVDMGLELYHEEPVFRSALDGCCELLRKDLGFDLRQVLYPAPQEREESSARLQRTAVTQPALFALEYSLAKLWMDFGIEPKGMIGHSIGEYVAACLSGVFSLEDALSLVAARGRLMEHMPAGTMLAAPLSEEQAQQYLGAELSLAAVNAPGLCVFSGSNSAIEALSAQLEVLGLRGRKLHTSHAFHSSLMDPIVWPFVQKVQSLNLKAPQIPYLSNLTGTWMTPDAALDPSYWGRHLRQTVRFGDGIAEVMKYPVILLEVGPGQALSTLARQQSSTSGVESVIVSSTRSPNELESDEAFLLNSLGKLWLNGAPVSWSRFYARERRRRLPLPTYPFERQRYWIGPVEDDAADVSDHAHSQRRDVTNWFYAPTWQERPLSTPQGNRQRMRWLVFSDGGAVGSEVTDTLQREGDEVWTAVAGEQFEEMGERSYAIRPSESADYERLVKQLRASSATPHRILHLWTAIPDGQAEASPRAFETHQSEGFYSLLFLAQALHKNNVTSPIQIGVVSTELHALSEGDTVCPSKSTLLGPCKVLPQELSNLRFKSIDIGDWREQEATAAELILSELSFEQFDPVVAYRGGQRFVQKFVPAPLGEVSVDSVKLRKGGVYLITGGLGNIGLAIAQALAESVKAKLVLIGRSEFPERASWEQRLASSPEDAVNRKISRLLELESLGSEVLVVPADSADAVQMAAAVRQAYERFGEIHGVIHGAGNTSVSAFTAASSTDQSVGDQHFRPKAHGLFVLEELFRGRDLDFVLLLSSLSGVLGGLGLLGYASANIFMDAFAARENQARRVPWISVNWDAWQFSGQESLFRRGTSQTAEFLYPAEGIECFRRIVEHSPRQIVVSTSDLEARIAKWILLESLRPKATKPDAAAASLHTRPNLSTQFVPPRNEVEKTVAEIWESILGVTPIGIYDKFFELGGHSLLAVQLISRLREAFQVELSAQRLFEAPTIAQLAATMEADLQAQRLAEEEEAARSEELLKMVEQLSEEEVAALLAQQDESSKTTSA
jgi:acyl transferase domain-containing protein/acyl carrier protein